MGRNAFSFPKDGKLWGWGERSCLLRATSWSGGSGWCGPDRAVPWGPRAARCLASWRTFACLRPHHSHMLSEKTLLVTVRPCDRQALLTHGRCQRFFQWGKLKPNHTSGTCTGLVAKEASFPLAILSNPGFTCICEFFYYYLCWQLKTWLQMWMKLITKTVAKNTPYFKPVLQMSMIFKMFSPCPAR